MTAPGKVVIFSAPSGSGKTTIVRHLLVHSADLAFSISATTRAPRGGEVDGKDYYFLTPEVFRQRIAAGDFVEYEEVYPDKFYGTLKEEVERLWAVGKDVVFDVDVKGGLALKSFYGERALAVFVAVPSLDILRQRLTERNTDSAADLEERIGKAEEELSYASRFDHILVNDKLPDALVRAEELLATFTAQ